MSDPKIEVLTDYLRYHVETTYDFTHWRRHNHQKSQMNGCQTTWSSLGGGQITGDFRPVPRILRCKSGPAIYVHDCARYKMPLLENWGINHTSDSSIKKFAFDTITKFVCVRILINKLSLTAHVRCHKSTTESTSSISCFKYIYKCIVID